MGKCHPVSPPPFSGRIQIQRFTWLTSGTLKGQEALDTPFYLLMLGCAEDKGNK